MIQDTGDRISQQAIESVHRGKTAFCKFLSANDTGLTGGHQCGILINTKSYMLLFDMPGNKGELKKRSVKFVWQGSSEKECNFTYYGSKNEYRITKFGRGFDLLRPDNTGALAIIVKMDDEDYEGWVLETEDEINNFLDYFSLSPADTGRLIEVQLQEEKAIDQMDSFIHQLKGEFPKAYDMSAAARKIYNDVYDHVENIVNKPDSQLLEWNKMEYSLFQRIEELQYGDVIRNGFPTMQDFIDTANSVLNRRKSRAGKSLEFHLEALFDGNDLRYESQVVTEEKKRPDFVFPCGKAYHDASYPSDKLTILAAKTTCKDRWRQVINEADRVKTKYLCTLQQGISPTQLHEMKSENVVLVVPQPYITTYPAEYREDIYSIAKFIAMVKEKGATYGR